MCILYRLTATLLTTFLLALPGTGHATSHYSFELEEKLTPLIEWRAYGPEAFREAIEQNKPIFLLLTAPSWCYWCQVYGSDEYLYNEQIYPYINEHFIPIYVDADKRQDLTRHYLEGGWPSTTVMAPNRERVYGFSGPRPVETMLENMRRAVEYVAQGGFFTMARGADYKPTKPRVPSATELKRQAEAYAEHSANRFDNTYGGFGDGQKFPQPRTHMAFLDRYEETLNQSPDGSDSGQAKAEQWLRMIERTLENQYTRLEEIKTNYNLYDPIEGGFHRYGTTRHWTPPHYEKMLSDNSKLLQLYARVADSTGNTLAKEVSDKTFNFLKNWYDKEYGGFAGNSDAFDEEHYYGEVNRPHERPRVEWTKYTDWNSDAILAFLDIGKRHNDPEALGMAEKTLVFFLREMLDEHGPYHYMSPDGTKGVQGNLLDSAALLVAVAEGYQATENALFLSGAVKIADYALANLYDWNGGGFFERNSPNTDLYALDELLLIEKPLEENGMMAYGLLLLYEETSDLKYLTAAVRTMGKLMENIPYLDGGYFLYRAALLALERDALTIFADNKEDIGAIEEQGKKTFFLTTAERQRKPLIERKPFVPAQAPDALTGPLLLLLFLAFLAGLLSLLSPCCLPLLPAYLAALLHTDQRHQRLMGVSFLVGLSVIFTLLGMSATFVGTFLREHLTVFTQVIGIVIIVFGVMTLLGKGFHGLMLTRGKPKTVLGAFLFGGALGLSWTPCVGPILVAILAVASTLDASFKGGLLLFAYAVGLGLPLVVLSSILEKLPKDGRIWKVLKGRQLSFSILGRSVAIHSTSLFTGVLFIVLGMLIFSGRLYTFNKYIAATDVQKWIFSLEQWLLHLVGGT